MVDPTVRTRGIKSYIDREDIVDSLIQEVWVNFSADPLLRNC